VARGVHAAHETAPFTISVRRAHVGTAPAAQRQATGDFRDAIADPFARTKVCRKRVPGPTTVQEMTENAGSLVRPVAPPGTIRTRSSSDPATTRDDGPSARVAAASLVVKAYPTRDSQHCG
jgi:hypothetical protein